MKIIEPSLIHDWDKKPCGKEVTVSTKLYKDAKDFYESVDESLHDDTVMYEVYSVSSQSEPGKLNWGLTVMHPVKVNGECNMTRGHFHENMDCEEYYWCSKGTGLLMLMDEEGRCWCEKMYEGSLHHIRSNWAHRLINTGDTYLKVVACWPADAGHDYARIEHSGFTYRIYCEGKDIIVKERKTNE